MNIFQFSWAYFKGKFPENTIHTSKKFKKTEICLLFRKLFRIDEILKILILFAKFFFKKGQKYFITESLGAIFAFFRTCGEKNMNL